MSVELLNSLLKNVSKNFFSGKPYRYFYAISSDVDGINPGTVSKNLLAIKPLCLYNKIICSKFRCAILLIYIINKFLFSDNKSRFLYEDSKDMV